MQLADIRKIRVMISSRSMTQVFGGTKLSDVRTRLQEFLHGVRWHVQSPGAGTRQQSRRVGRDQALFDVWIHENDAGRPADRSTLAISLEEIGKADVVVVLYTGEAGSAADDREIGICHAELQEALARRPEIVSIIDLLPLQRGSAPRDKNFRDFVDRQSLYRKDADSESSLQETVAELLQERVSVLAGRGASVGARKRDRGQALDWRRDDLTTRQEKMREALALHLRATAIGPSKGADTLQIVTVGGQTLAVRLDAIPAPLTVAAAREKVGQPFLRDHLHWDAMDRQDVPGVVHLIACHRGITEAQATRILGTPDAISVPGDFGVYVADHVQKVQLVFLMQCADETAIAMAVRHLNEWLLQTGEGLRVVERARSRRLILAAMFGQLSVAAEVPTARRAAARRTRKA
jgi:hypothetical protein